MLIFLIINFLLSVLAIWMVYVNDVTMDVSVNELKHRQDKLENLINRLINVNDQLVKEQQKFNKKKVKRKK